MDQDGDGLGESGWLGELAGVDSIRVSGNRISTAPFIAQCFGVKDERGCATRKGYLFRMWLPTGSGRARGEARVEPAGVDDPADADHQERRFACYAWPVERGRTGRRAFVVTHHGEVFATAADVRAYSGSDPMPIADSAFSGGPNPLNLDGALGSPVETTACRDGNVWRPTGVRPKPCGNWAGLVPLADAGSTTKAGPSEAWTPAGD